MVSIVPKDVAAIYNHVWQQPRQTTTLAGMVFHACRPHAFKLARLVEDHPSAGNVWVIEFSLVGDHWHGPNHAMRQGDITIRDFHALAHQVGWGSVSYKDYVRCGAFKIEKVRGNLKQFQIDWTLLLMFDHEFDD